MCRETGYTTHHKLNKSRKVPRFRLKRTNTCALPRTLACTTTYANRILVQLLQRMWKECTLHSLHMRTGRNTWSLHVVTTRVRTLEHSRTFFCLCIYIPNCHCISQSVRTIVSLRYCCSVIPIICCASCTI